MGPTAHRTGGIFAAMLGLLPGLSLSTREAIPYAVGALIGATLPDRMELPIWNNGVRTSLIPHRTLTHWVVPWLFAGWFSVKHVMAHGGMLWWGVTGVVAGVMTHLFLDWLTPMGIPIISPFSRSSARRWRRW